MTKSNSTTDSKQSSALWYKEINDGIIMIASGWNDGMAGPEFDRQWLEPITREEFLRRRSLSGVLFRPTA
jgi:hypothetical protein